MLSITSLIDPKRSSAIHAIGMVEGVGVVVAWRPPHGGCSEFEYVFPDAGPALYRRISQEGSLGVGVKGWLLNFCTEPTRVPRHTYLP